MQQNGSLEFCDFCGDYVAPESGQLRAGDNGKAIAVCNTCDRVGQSVSQPAKVEPGGISIGSTARSGTTGDPGGQNGREFRENG